MGISKCTLRLSRQLTKLKRTQLVAMHKIQVDSFATLDAQHRALVKLEEVHLCSQWYEGKEERLNPLREKLANLRAASPRKTICLSSKSAHN